MMGFNGGMMGTFGFFGLITWLSLIAFLLTGAYYFYTKAKKKR